MKQDPICPVCKNKTFLNDYCHACKYKRPSYEKTFVIIGTSFFCFYILFGFLYPEATSQEAGIVCISLFIILIVLFFSLKIEEINLEKKHKNKSNYKKNLSNWNERLRRSHY